MDKVDSYKEVKNKYYKISLKTPYYIDTSSNDDFIVYHNYRNILEHILSMVNNKSYADLYVDKMVDNCNNSMDKIYEIWNSDKDYEKLLLMMTDMMSFIEGILLDSEEVELYEICHNIKRFDERFYLENDEK